MKKTRRIFTALIVIVFAVYLSLQTVAAYTLTNLSIGGSTVYYRGTSTPVQIPDVYEKQKFDMRAVWISALAGDVSINGETQFKTAMNTAIETMKYFNMNTMVFHIRTQNDAFYPSTLNPKSTYVSSIDFNSFNPLEWLITRCHEEGIEFHAWMNPYRVNTTYSFPTGNPASNSSNLLTGASSTILNPGLPLVRQFLYDTVMEVIENYDVDAIHFDDYFYTSGIDDTTTYNNYNPNGLALDDWRRNQVDTFIQELSNTMRNYNEENNCYVQLGISPTGIYQNVSSYAEAMNGTYNTNGDYSSIGSNTDGQTHYGNYLYADTKKWVDNEWLDYITPQSYWAFTHTVAGYADVMDWWAKVVAQKDVNLYSGMGLYMASSDYTYNAFSWKTHYDEAAMHIKYITKHPEVKGTFIYSYRYLLAAKNGGTTNDSYNAINILPLWNYESLTPEIRTMTPVTLGSVNNFSVNSNSLSWDLLSGAKKYAIYRTTGGTISSSIDELIAVVGNTTTSYVDSTADPEVTYKYGIRAISGTNTEGLLSYQSATPAESISISGASTVGISQTTQLSATVNPITALQEVVWNSSNKNVARVSNSGLVTGVAEGSATITATCASNPSITKTHAVTVSAPSPTNITISGPYTVAAGNSITLSASVFPIGANQDVTWSSSNTNNATVNPTTGVVTGVRNNKTAIITATSTVNSGVTGTFSIQIQTTPTSFNISYELNDGSWSWTTGTVATIPSGLYAGAYYIDANSNLPEIFMQDFYKYLKDNNLLTSALVDPTLQKTTWAEFSSNGSDPRAWYNHTSTGSYSATDGYSQYFWTSIDSVNAVATGGFFGTEPYKTKYANLLCHLTYLVPLRYTSIVLDSSTGKSATGFVLDGYFYGTQTNLTGYFATLRQKIPTPVLKWNSTGTTSTPTTYESTTCSSSTSVQLKEPFREGYLFDGWYIDPYFSGTPILETTGGISQSKYYSKWIAIEDYFGNDTSLEIIANKTKLNVGEVLELSVLGGYSVDWESSNNLLALVNSSDLLNTFSAGTVTITASHSLDPSIQGTIVLNIIDPAPTSVSITGATEVDKNATINLTATVSPTSADQSVTWSSSNTEVAIVSNVGVVTGVSGGVVTISAISTLDSQIIGTHSVTVFDSTLAPNSISIIGGASTLQIGNTTDLSINILPIYASQEVEWSSSNENIATVNSSGTVTGIAAGFVTITVTSTINGSVNDTKEIEIEVVAVSSLSISGTSNLVINNTTQLTANVLPINATDKSVAWSSSNPLIASVSETGLVTAVGIGTVIITATSTSNLNANDTFEVVVSGIDGITYYNIDTSVNNDVYGSIQMSSYNNIYGSANSITITPSQGYRYLFLTENNKLISFNNTYSFKVNENAFYKAYFIPDNMNYVLFMDQNRNVLSVELCTYGVSATAPNTELIPTKTGYTFSHWSQSYSNVVEDIVVLPIYSKDITQTYTITVVNGTVESTTASYDETVTVTTSNPSTFSYWTRNNKIVSFDLSYTFSVYGDETVTAVLKGYTEEAAVASISPVAIDSNIENGLLSFVGAYSLPTQANFIETGMLVYEGNLLGELTVATSGVNKIKSSIFSSNNEFAVTLNGVKLTEKWNTCTYVAYLVNEVVYYAYSDVVTYQAALSDEELITNIVGALPNHIYDNYDFPTYEGLVWSYQTGQDSSLFDLEAGTYTSVYSLNVAYRTIVGTLNSYTATKEINFGILANGQVGKFYSDKPIYVPENAWNGWTLSRATDDAVLFLVKDLVNISVSSNTTYSDVEMNQIWSTQDSTLKSCGNVIVNSSSVSASITFNFTTAALDSNLVSTDKAIKIDLDGEILAVYSLGDTNITLTQGQALFVTKILDRELGLGVGYTVGTNFVLSHIREINNNCFVTFNNDGVETVVKVLKDTAVAEPTEPTKEGYIFVEWRLNGVAYNFSTPVTTNIMLVAYFIADTASVTYNLNGGSITSNDIIGLRESTYIQTSRYITEDWSGGSIMTGTTLTGVYWEAMAYKNTGIEGVYELLGKGSAYTNPEATFYVCYHSACTSIYKDELISVYNTAVVGSLIVVTGLPSAESTTANIGIYFVAADAATANVTIEFVSNANMLVPIRDGYVFLGWCEEPDLSDTPITVLPESASSSEIAYYAKWFDEEGGTYTINYDLDSGSWSWSTGTVTTNGSGNYYIDGVSNLPEIFMQDFYKYLKDNNLLTSALVDPTLQKTTWEEFSSNGSDPRAWYNHTTTGLYSATDGYSQHFWTSIDSVNAVATGGFFGTEPYKTKYANLLCHLTYLVPLRYTSIVLDSSTGKSATGFVLDGYFYGTQNNGTGNFTTLRQKIPTPVLKWSSDGVSSIPTTYQITTYPYGTSAILRMPLKDGFVFEGWYDNPALTGSQINSIASGANPASMYYAKWTDVSTYGSSSNPTSLIVTAEKTSLMIGSTSQLTVNGGYAVTWSSGNTGIATVNSSGLVSGVSAGNVTITATLITDTNVKGTITLSITTDPFDKLITFGTNPTYSSNATLEMTNPFYWLRKAENAGLNINEVLLSTSEIAAQNTIMINQGNMRLVSPSTLAGKTTVTSSEVDSLKNTFGYSLPSGWDLQSTVQHAVVTSFSQMKNYPTTSTTKTYMETGLEVGEGVAIYGKYSSGSWLLVRSQNYFGWIPASTVGTCTGTQMATFANPSSFAVVTAERIKTTQVSGLPTMLRMGTKLPLVSSNSTSATVKVPTRNSDGTLNTTGVNVSIPIDNNEYIHVGYLPYTTKNVVKQMFKMLGQVYGWGDLGSDRDCSSTVWAAYKCSGFLLARNTTQQELISTSTYTRVYPSSNIGTNYSTYLPNVRMGAIMLMSGHVVMYLGKVGTRYYIIHQYGSSYCQVTDTKDYSFYNTKTFIK